jgi:hypothetical protein
MSYINCPKCNSLFDNYSKWGFKKFCSRTCANSRNFSEDSKRKKSESIKKYLASLSDTEYFEYIKKTHPNKTINPVDRRLKSIQSLETVIGEYSRIYLCTCKYSGIQFYSKTVKQVHPNLARTKKEYTYSCQFRFAISNYFFWFTNATELINTYGWYSTPGSKKGLNNTNGISRDHLYSITDGWINNVPPSIIRHPANCALIPHKQNQSKYKKSKITLDELHKKIDLFNQLAGQYGDDPHLSGLESDVLPT